MSKKTLSDHAHRGVSAVMPGFGTLALNASARPYLGKAYVRTLGYNSTRGFQSAPLHERHEKETLKQSLEEKSRKLRHKTLLLSAAMSENAAIRQNIGDLMKENARLEEALVSMAALESLS